jgi:ATP-dependent protease ClpP protease subunit
VVGSEIPSVVDHPRAPTITFYDEVTRDSCLQLTSALTAAEQEVLEQHDDEGAAQYIRLRIQSSGGSLTSALFVCDFMDRLRVPVWTCVDGVAASAASLIAVSGSTRTMSRHSVVLVHQASIDLPEMKHDELRDEEYNMDLLMSGMRDVYLSHTHMNPSQLDALLANEKYLNAEDSSPDEYASKICFQSLASHLGRLESAMERMCVCVCVKTMRNTF